MFSLNSVTNFLQKKLFVPETFCVRDQDVTTANKTHVRERIFKLSPIDVSVIYQESLNSLNSLNFPSV